MDLTVDSLSKAGGFTGPPVKREVSWTQNGQEFTADVYVRKLSYHSAMSDILSVNGSIDPRAARIAHCICDEAGKPVFQISDITGYHQDGSPVMTKVDGEDVERGAIDGNLATALMYIIAEVSGLGKPKAKRSPRKKKSGTS